MHRACERRGWSISQFLALPTSEQDTLLAYEYQRWAGIQDAIKRIFDQDEKHLAEVITARAILEMLQHI